MGNNELLTNILDRLELIYTLELIAFGAAVVFIIVYLLYRLVINFM